MKFKWWLTHLLVVAMVAVNPPLIALAELSADESATPVPPTAESPGKTPATKPAPSVAAVNRASSLSASERAAIRHQVRLTSDGTLNGELYSVGGSGTLIPVRGRIYFIQSKQIVARVASNADGIFKVDNNQLKPGVFSLVAVSRDGFASRAVQIVSSNHVPDGKVKAISLPQPDNKAVSGPAERLSVRVIPAPDYPKMIEILGKQFPQLLKHLDNAPVASPAGPRPQTPMLRQSTPNVRPPISARGVTTQTGSSEIKMASFARAANAALQGGGTQVSLNANGSLSGTLQGFDSSGNLVPAGNTSVSFIQNGQVVASAMSDASGQFQVPGLQPGSYTVVAAGPGGFAVYSADVSAFDPNADPQSGLANPVMDMAMVPPSDVSAIGSILEAEGFSFPGTAGGAAGPVGSLGTGTPTPTGGGGGGGGLGGLLGPAALGAGLGALLAAALASNSS